MSRDYQLAWPCPHLTVEEVVALSTVDRQSLDTRQPVAASGTVRILVNDEFFIPQGGLYSTAQLFGTTSGPFDLVENEDILTVTTAAGTQTVTFNVTGTERLSAKKVIDRLRTANFSGVVEVVNGHLVFTDASKVGIDSLVEVSGTAAAALGFGAANINGHQRGARGKQVYPGWQLHVRPDEITNRYPRFNSRIRNAPVFKVTYAVPPTRCLRCRGSYIENDYRFDQAGQAILIENEDLLYQASLKIILTERGSNPYHPWYGTTIKSRIGAKALGGVSSLISEDVRRALSRLQAAQNEQAKYQTVSFKERLYAIQDVQVFPHAQDPTTFLIEVTVSNASADPISLNIVFTVPETVALMGSNGLFLGPEYVGLTSEAQKTLFTGAVPKALVGA